MDERKERLFKAAQERLPVYEQRVEDYEGDPQDLILRGYPTAVCLDDTAHLAIFLNDHDTPGYSTQLEEEFVEWLKQNPVS